MLFRSLEFAPLPTEWRTLRGQVRHTFTHFHLELSVLAARATVELDGHWCPRRDLDDAGLPSVMQKVVKLALKAG